jgi:hypothetical protein
MIQADHLIRRYGKTVAVDEITAPKGRCCAERRLSVVWRAFFADSAQPKVVRRRAGHSAAASARRPSGGHGDDRRARADSRPEQKWTH